MLRSILVPLDGSPFGEHALPMAVSLARRGKATIHLVHVHTMLEATYAELQLFDSRGLDTEMRQTERAYLQRIQRMIETTTGVTVTARNVDGEVEPALRGVASKLAVDVVVMTTHARGPVGRFWLGSVGDELIRDLPMPLLLVHPKKEPPDLHQDVRIEHILVPLAGGPFFEEILRPAREYARLFGADITLLQVVKPIYPVTLPAEPGPVSGAAIDLLDRVEVVHEQFKKDARAYLETVAQRLRDEGMSARTMVTVEPEPGSAILEQAHKPIDLIAMETHGRHGLSRLIFGSSADKVIRGSTLPVLVHCTKEK